MKKATIYILFIYLLTVSLSAYSQDLQIHRLTIDQGLANNVVKCIYQDRKGFIYIGTQDGLCRYDGYEFKSFESKLGDTTTISSNNICSLLEDSKENFWIGTLNTGINKLDRKTGKFKRYKYEHSYNNNSVVVIYEDKQHTIWVYDGTIYQYLPSLDKFRESNLKLNVSNPIVRFFYEDRDHQFWIGTNIGLYRYNRKTGAHKLCLPNSGIHDSLSNATLSISEDSSGVFYIGTFHGLYQYNKKTEKFTFLKSCSKQGHAYKEIYSIRNDDRFYWMAWQIMENRTIGISKYDKVLKKNSDYFFNDTTVSVSENVPINMLEDKSGLLWVGTYLGGLLKIEKDKLFQNRMYDKTINAFFENMDGTLWLSTTNNSLYHCNPKTQEIKEYHDILKQSAPIADNSITTIFQDHTKQIWMGTKSGAVYHFQGLSKRFLNTASIIELKGAIKNITEDAMHRIWIGVENKGLYLYNPDTKILLLLNQKSEGKNSISNNSIESILADSVYGDLWVGTWNGLNRLILPKKKSISIDQISFVPFHFDIKDSNSINDNRIISLYMTRNGILWVGTAGGGLQKIEYNHKIPFHETKYKITRYTVEKGLPNNVVYGILEDGKGCLWLSTNKGLSKFNPKTETTVNFDANDGLKSSQFFWRSFYKSPSGKMYFGSIKGYYSFYPDSITVNQYIPPVYITGLSIFNKPQILGSPGSLLTANIEATEKLIIPYNQSVISFDYVTLNYIASQKNKYSYKLEGFDNDWQQVGNQRKATYTNLDPGTYIFKVKAANNNGIWNEKGTSLILIIKPPFWKTIWFRSLLIAFILLGIFLYIQSRIYHLEKQNLLLENKVKERTNSLVEINTVLEENQEEISMQKEELVSQRDTLANTNTLLQEQKKKIEEQNEELHLHRTQLESIVESRTDELEKALYKSKESDRLKSSFLANMSHEIRTPMNAILGFTSLLSNENLSEAERKEFLRVISTSGESLMVLINDILDLSLIQANQLLLTPAKANLTELLNEIYESFALESHNTRIDFSIVSPALPVDFSIKTDVIRLKQVFNNLISNAFKFTDRGRIEFGVCDMNDMITFFVKDTGIGITEENDNAIFDRFFKIENNKKVLYRGAGLGLTICKLLIELWGGKIWYKTEIGVGTTFYFTHPNTKPESFEITKQDSLLYKLPDLKGKTILIAEDTESNFKLIKAFIASTNVTILWKQNGQEVIDYMKDHDVDLILMDIKMPIIDGNETTRFVKSIKPQIPIIAQTAFAYENEIHEMYLSGVNEYIVKPIKRNDIIKILWKYMS